VKRYTLSACAASAHAPEHPERTARRNASRAPMDFDVAFQVWPSRGAMARSIRMQQRRETRTDWRACVALRDGEGY